MRSPINSRAAALTGLLALAGASTSLAAPPSDKGKPPATGPGCKPRIAVILKGTLAGNGAAAPFALSLTVNGGNHFAAAYRKASQPLSLQVVATTRINRQGDTNPADLKAGDSVNVQARACKADLANGATPGLTLVRVSAHPA